MKHLVVLIIALLISSAAMAEGECQADKQKFCKDVAKSDVGACFDKHAAELSEACKAKREARAKKNAEESAKMGKEEGTHTEPGPRCSAGKRYKQGGSTRAPEPHNRQRDAKGVNSRKFFGGRWLRSVPLGVGVIAAQTTGVWDAA